MKIIEKKFSELDYDKNIKGIVIIGLWGSPNEHIQSITNMLYNKGVLASYNPEDIWKEGILLETIEGRKDLMLILKNKNESLIKSIGAYRLSYDREYSYDTDYKINHKSDFERIY
jgi:hypothetical protein